MIELASGSGSLAENFLGNCTLSARLDMLLLLRKKSTTEECLLNQITLPNVTYHSNNNGKAVDDETRISALKYLENQAAERLSGFLRFSLLLLFCKFTLSHSRHEEMVLGSVLKVDERFYRKLHT